MLEIMTSQRFRWLAIAFLFAGSRVGPLEGADPKSPTWSGDVAAIVYQKCTSCHRPGQAGPFPFLSYEDVSGRAATIAAVLKEDYMPPWPPAEGHLAFAHDRRLTDKQKITLLTWIKNGTPAGDRSKEPSLPEFHDGWALGVPDIIAKMEEPYTVPPDGPDIYRSFVVPINLPEDKWIKAIELRPQARSVVHHVLYFAANSAKVRARDARDPVPGFHGMPAKVEERIGGYVPGVVPEFLPDDLALHLPAGTDLVLQTHFHPTGKQETEQMTVGLYLTDKPPKREMLPIQIPPLFGRLSDIDIPAGASRYTVTDQFELPAPVRGYLVGGHAHYICREMKMVAKLPDGTERTLLQIDDWDLDWQGQYTFQKPVDLPQGTILKTTLVYDNSDNNPQNPFYPPRRVTWGEQSTDEMGSMTLTAVAKSQQGEAAIKMAYHAKVRKMSEQALRDRETRTWIRKELTKRITSAADGSRLFAALDKNQNGCLEKAELPERVSQRLFRRLDLDTNGNISRKEWSALINRFRPQ